MAKCLFTFIGNKRGSLMGALVAFGLLGISVSGLITYIQHFSKTSSQTAEQINFNPQFLDTVLGNMKSLLIDPKKSTTGLSQNGICALVKPSTSKLKKSVEDIVLNVSKLTNGSVNLRWTTFFSSAVGWTSAPASEQNTGGKCDQVAGGNTTFSSSNLMKCFEYTGDTERSNKIYVVAQILPKKFPNNTDASSNNSLEAKNVAFHLKASIGVVPFQDDSGVVNKVTYINTRSAILWANSAGSCTINEYCAVDADCSQSGATCSSNVCSPQSPQVVKLSTSGMIGASDEGILNAKLTNTKDNCAGLEIGDLKPYATQGTKALVQGTGVDKWAFKDDGTAIYMACVMKKFRCKNDNWTQSDVDTFFDEGMHFTFQVDNNIGRPVTIEKMNPVLQGYGTENPIAYAIYSLAPNHPFKVIQGGADDGKFEKISGITYSSNSLFKEEPAPSTKLTLRIPPGGGQFKVIVRGNEACSTTNLHCTVYNVCHGVCQNNRNWYPTVTITAKDSKLGTCTRTKNYSANNIDCISCFAKSCHRLGAGTVGKRTDIPMEALDSQLPECKAAGAGSTHETERKIANSNTFSGTDPNENTAPNTVTDIDSLTARCIALNLDTDTDGTLDDSDSNGKLDVEENFKSSTFAQKTCTTAYPVLCYANGRYQPATQWDATLNGGQGGYKLKEATYANAQKACYEMGKEVLDKTHLKEYMEDAGGGTFSNTDICSGTNCEFVNNATRGMFFLPTYDVGEIFNKSLLSGKTFIWVAAELDRGGLVVAAPLKADIATGGSNNYALFNRKERLENYDPVLLKENAIGTGGASDPYVVVYSVKYKGLIKRPKATLLRFVCQKGTQTGGSCTDSSQSTKATCTGTWDHDGDTSTAAVDRVWVNAGAAFFLTRTTDNYCNGTALNGQSKCAQEGGYFVAPESALDYSRIMMLLKNASNADPTAETGDEYVVPVSSLGTATNHVHTQSVANSVQAWVAVNEVDTAGAAKVTCP